MSVDLLIADDIAPGLKRAASPALGHQNNMRKTGRLSRDSYQTNAVAGPSNPRKRKATDPVAPIEVDMDEVESIEDEEKQLQVSGILLSLIFCASRVSRYRRYVVPLLGRRRRGLRVVHYTSSPRSNWRVYLCFFQERSLTSLQMIDLPTL